MMNFSKQAKKTAQILTIAGGVTLALAGAAAADCRVENYDKKGFLGIGNQTFTTTFSGNSAQRIWEKSCKPFIQRNIARHNILNGEFGMHCTGRLHCDIKGRLENGRLILIRQDFGNSSSRRTTTQTVERNNAIYTDPNWAKFDAQVAACENRATPRCAR